nr:MAG TPA: hypothetical protein [Caudoviricetes sp.]
MVQINLNIWIRKWRNKKNFLILKSKKLKRLRITIRQIVQPF